MIGRGELASAVATASMGLPKRPVVPVLGGMLVTVSAGMLELSTFDYETAIRLQVQADTDGAVTVLVPGKELVAAVKALPKTRGAMAMLAVADDGIVIECDGAETSLSALPREEYPQLPALPEHAGDIDATAFAGAVGRVAACTGTDDTLPVLTCVHFASEGGRLELAATDRYRLGAEPVSWTGDGKWDVLVPAVQLTGFVKKMRRDGKVSVYIGDERAVFSDGTLTVFTHLNPGTFPKYRQHIRDAGGDMTVITADAKTLAAAITRVGAMCERNAPLTFTVTGGKVTLTARTGDGAGSTQAVRVQADGPDFETGFSHAYLASLLAGIGGEAEISFVHPHKPAMVRAGEFTGVCMPIRLQQ